jgi:hypothetical protein
MWTAIHMCMEATLGNFLYSYLYLKPAKTDMSFSLSPMFSKKSENKRVEQVWPEPGLFVCVGGGRVYMGVGANRVYICE